MTKIQIIVTVGVIITAAIVLAFAWQRYEHTGGDDAGFRDSVQKQMRIPTSFDEAGERLLPQIMPASVSGDASLIQFPFGGSLSVGIVVDDARGYTYLTTDVLTKCGKTKDELYERAIQNLEHRSKGMQIRQLTNGEMSFIGVIVSDGYDAARILLPRLRRMLGVKLGAPFNVGIPNRDFLICWPVSNAPEVDKLFLNKLKEDFDKRPYPLSLSIFQVEADGTIGEKTKPQPTSAGDVATRAAPEK